jgi:hypothetical protein
LSSLACSNDASLYGTTWCLHHESRHRDRFQIVCLVGLGKSLDACGIL